jgi:hypothetical protein
MVENRNSHRYLYEKELVIIMYRFHRMCRESCSGCGLGLFHSTSPRYGSNRKKAEMGWWDW